MHLCPPRGSISKIAMLLCVITVRQHSSIAILLMDPRGIWLMKPNVFCKVFSTFRKSSNVSPTRVHQQNSNAAVCEYIFIYIYISCLAELVFLGVAQPLSDM